MGAGDYTPPARPRKPLTKAQLRAMQKKFEGASERIDEIQEQEADILENEREDAQENLEDELGQL